MIGVPRTAAESARLRRQVMRSEEAFATVEQVDGNRRSKPARVLRAADVIPPFGADVAKPREPDEGSEGSKLPRAQAGRSKSEQEHRRVPEPAGGGVTADRAGPPSSGTVEVPMYDLAENILAEHRRLAARRRKAPGQVQVEAAPACVVTDLKAHNAALSSSMDLLELQRVVAQIVARDIERLCKRPGKAPCG